MKKEIIELVNYHYYFEGIRTRKKIKLGENTHLYYTPINLGGSTLTFQPGKDFIKFGCQVIKISELEELLLYLKGESIYNTIDWYVRRGYPMFKVEDALEITDKFVISPDRTAYPISDLTIESRDEERNLKARVGYYRNKRHDNMWYWKNSYSLLPVEETSHLINVIEYILNLKKETEKIMCQLT